MIERGNISQKIATHPETRGWFLGHFMPEWDFFHSEDFELKWSEYPEKWKIYEGSVSSTSRKTIAILIDWKGVVLFPDTKEEVMLEKIGDYVTFDTALCRHSFKSLQETTVVLAIRTPSKHD